VHQPIPSLIFKDEALPMLKSPWRSVMDPDRNALAGLPKPVKFQLMVTLALMWSAIFCANAGLLIWLPEYVLAHAVLIFFGIFGTSWLFRIGRQSMPEPVKVRSPADNARRDV
jgi:hypothetical protein